MDLTTRIEQFRNMAQADPTNEMAHFSLGQSLLNSGDSALLPEAVAAFTACIRLNPDMSKAYQLCGQALAALGEKGEAVRILTEGYSIAARKGDLMPKNAMADQLAALGAPLPAVAASAPAGPSAPSGSFICSVTGRPGTKLAKPPFKGPLGEKIAETVSQETWRAWIGQGTKVINELRLDLSRPDHDRVYEQHMLEFLQLTDWAEQNLTR